MPETAKRERILVLGASGFIGKHVVKALCASDWAHPVATHFRTPLQLVEPVEILPVDARDAAALRRAVAGISGVVNCITGDAATIVASARALLEACSTLTLPPRIVNLSTMMVYGTATGTVDEATPLRGDWDGYSAAKTEVEYLSRTYPAVVHLRPGIVYGPDSPIWSERIGHWLRARQLGDLGFVGQGYCNLVHVDDVVRAILCTLRLRGIEGEAFNLSLTSPPTWNEYFKQFAAALETPFVPISRAQLKFELYVAAPPLKLAQIVAHALRSKRPRRAPIRPWLLRLCGHTIQLNVEKAERVLGMQWTPLEEGLRQSASSLQAALRPGGVRHRST
jgi:nucleoside-diphosphate-sugar epimerase